MAFIFHALKMILAAAFTVAVLTAIVAFGTPWIVAFIIILLYLIFRGTASPEKK